MAEASRSLSAFYPDHWTVYRKLEHLERVDPAGFAALTVLINDRLQQWWDAQSPQAWRSLRRPT